MEKELEKRKTNRAKKEEEKMPANKQTNIEVEIVLIRAFELSVNNMLVDLWCRCSAFENIVYTVYTF